MAPPVAVYVVAAVVGVAALFAFKELVYEPHLAPTFEAWAEDFLERRRAARSRRASAVPVNSTRRRSASSSSDASHHTDDPQGDRGDDQGVTPNDFPRDTLELETLSSRGVDEWRNEVLRSQTRATLRKRRTDRANDSDGFDLMSSTMDESFPSSLTYTPHAHVISNVSSPMSHSTISLPQTPHRPRSESQSTVLRDAGASLVLPRSPPVPIPEVPRTPSPDTVDPLLRTQANSATRLDIACPSPLAIPNGVDHSPVNDVVPRPLPFTPTYQVMVDDSPFGPLLPDTPRSSAEMYGERPFSPITRVMGSSGYAPAPKANLPRANSTSSIRTFGGAGVRRGSGLANEVFADASDDGSDAEHEPRVNLGPAINESVISSLSERYPAPPTPPVIISPPVSSIGLISAPSSPRSAGSGVMVQLEGDGSRPPVPLLHLSLDTSPPLSPSRSRSSQMHSAASPALSFVSAPFLSPMPVSRAASGSEVDEFLSVASDESDWHASFSNGPVPDPVHNPFLDQDVLERASEVGSDESWGSARRH